MTDQQPPLADRLATAADDFCQPLSPDDQSRICQAIDDLAASGIVDNSLEVGDVAPDFAIPDAAGDEVRLTSLLATGPVVVKFYLGGWFPCCRLDLTAYQEALPSFQEKGARIVAVSPQTVKRAWQTAKDNAIDFKLLCDSENVIARRFGLVHTLPTTQRPLMEKLGVDLPEWNGGDGFDLPLPATFAIGSDRVVRFAFVDADPRRRADPHDVLAAL